MSEEAEERRNVHFLLTHLCGISHRIWRSFLTICTDAAWLSQYRGLKPNGAETYAKKLTI
ncbi:hypothetical protein V9V65_004799 [Escherichia coli]